jgi:hypothetical protein
MPDSISYVGNKDIGPELTEAPWYKGMTSSLESIAHYSERARESSPGMLDLTPVGGVAVTKQSHVQYRVLGLIITDNSNDVLQLTIAGNVYTFYVIAGLSPMILFPITIARGQDISIASTGVDTSFSCFLFYYSE